MHPIGPGADLDFQLAASDGPSLRLTLASLTEAEGASGRKLSSAARYLKTLSAERLRELGLSKLQVFCARSVTVEPLLPAWVVAAAAQGFLLDVNIGSFGGYFDELLDPKGPIGRGNFDLVVLFLDLEHLTAGAMAPATDSSAGAEVGQAAAAMCQLVRGARSISKARIIVHGLVMPEAGHSSLVVDANTGDGLATAVRQINEEVGAACRELTDVLFFDLDRWASRVGKERARDERLFQTAAIPIAPACATSYARAFARHIATAWGRRKKLLVTDLDDTLWGGTVGEHGADGILTGATFPGSGYRPYQACLARLASQGVLLAIASKNDFSTVDEAFARRQADILVPFNSFVAKRIGWGPKSASIRAIAEELGIGLDAVVFVDDSAVECAEVRANLPEVAIVQASAQTPWETPRLLEVAGHFDHLGLTDDDRQRSAIYRAQGARKAQEQQAPSREAFLRSLQMHCSFIDAREAPFARAWQLISKTNQFNATSRRYSEGELRDLLTPPRGRGWAVRVQDCFGDNGVVGLAVAVTTEQRWVIDTLLLSCRVIGRGVETALLSHVCAQASAAQAHLLIGEYVPTGRNHLCAELYPAHGFTVVPAEDGTPGLRFVLDLTKADLPAPTWITIEPRTPT